VTQRTRRRTRREPATAADVERGVRQLLADKVSGTMAGVWLLAPEHLRLGTFDLLCAWLDRPGAQVQPRLALQVMHEAALCLTGVRRAQGALSQKGFELANGLPFVATDQALHDLFAPIPIQRTQGFQVALGLMRRAGGHFQGDLLAIDPHHLRSFTKRQTRRHRHKETEEAVKTVQTFFCFDVQTQQPVAFTLGSSSRTVSQGAPELLALARDILQPRPGQTLVLADNEHLTADLFAHVAEQTPFDLLAPMPRGLPQQERLARLPHALFAPRWAGFATARQPYRFAQRPDLDLLQIIQRGGETPDAYHYTPFLATTDQRDDLDLLLRDFPRRWRLEEFFNDYQAMGWNRAGTLNLNIRYAHLSLALAAQASVHQLRQRLGPPYDRWEADHLAKHLLMGLDGDIRVHDDTIVVTFYNAPAALRPHYEHLPAKLRAEGLNPRLPWLYDFQLDFRFR